MNYSEARDQCRKVLLHPVLFGQQQGLWALWATWPTASLSPSPSALGATLSKPLWALWAGCKEPRRSRGHCRPSIASMAASASIAHPQPPAGPSSTPRASPIRKPPPPTRSLRPYDSTLNFPPQCLISLTRSVLQRAGLRATEGVVDALRDQAVEEAATRASS